MTLNEYCLKFYGRHWIQLDEATRKDAHQRHNNLFHILGDNALFGNLFGKG